VRGHRMEGMVGWKERRGEGEEREREVGRESRGGVWRGVVVRGVRRWAGECGRRVKGGRAWRGGGGRKGCGERGAQGMGRWG